MEMILLVFITFPPEATDAIKRAADAAEAARQAYYDELDSTKKKLIIELEKQQELATKRGDLDSALAIRKELERIKNEDFVTLIEDVIGRSRATRNAEKSLMGKWAVELVDKGKVTYASEWTFKQDGSVTSTNRGGAPRGTWRVDLGIGEIKIVWSETAWESMTLPLSDDRTATGRSWSGATLRARKAR